MTAAWHVTALSLATLGVASSCSLVFSSDTTDGGVGETDAPIAIDGDQSGPDADFRSCAESIAPISCLRERFDDTLDRWEILVSSPAASIDEATLRIPVPTGAAARAGIRSLGRFDLTDSSLALKVVAVPLGIDVAESSVTLLRPDAQSGVALVCFEDNLQARVLDPGDGWESQGSGLCDPATRPFWRIRHSSKDRVILFETSQDGEQWLGIGEIDDVGLELTELHVGLIVEPLLMPATPGDDHFIVDEVNP